MADHLRGTGEDRVGTKMMICPKCKGACRINDRRYAEKPLSPDSVEIAKECLCRGTGAVDVEVSEYERGAASKDVAARLQRALGD